MMLQSAPHAQSITVNFLCNLMLHQVFRQKLDYIPGRGELSMENLVIHLVDGDTRSRAEHARVVLALGHHTELYSHIDELLHQAPEVGVILVRQSAADCDPNELFARIGDENVCLPVIIASADPDPEQVVAATKAGALDYLYLPLEADRLERSLTRVQAEAAVHGRARHRVLDSRRRVSRLSSREREVLECISFGCSNKVIARQLGISPRTVEIHRANMMGKLPARHAAEAIRVWLQAGLESTIGPLGEAAAPLQLRDQARKCGHHGQAQERCLHVNTPA
jgi:FixJ family two-component response regulator